MAKVNTDAAPNERLVFAALNCVGLPVQVYMKAGTVYEGIFKTAQLDPKLENAGSVVLSKVRTRQHGPKGLLSEALTLEIVLNAHDVVQIVATNVDMAFAKVARQKDDPMHDRSRRGFQTDTEIGSTSRFHSADSRANELVAWDAGTQSRPRGGHRQGGPVAMELEADVSGTSWDQFKLNEKKFGVKTTWDENLYTTKLDIAEVGRDQLRTAERLAREIEKKSRAGSTDDMDEEDRFGAVLRENTRFSPPASATAGAGGVASTNGASGGGGGSQARLASDGQGKYVPPNRRMGGAADTAPSDTHHDPHDPAQPTASRDEVPAKRVTGAPPGIGAAAKPLASPPPAAAAAHVTAAAEQVSTESGAGQSSRSKEVASLRKFSENFNLEADPTSKKAEAKTESASSKEPPAPAQKAEEPAPAKKLNPNAVEFKPNPNASEFVPSAKKAVPAPAPAPALQPQAQAVSGMFMPGMVMPPPPQAVPMYVAGMQPPPHIMPNQFGAPYYQNMQQMQQMQMMMHQQQQHHHHQQQGYMGQQQFQPPSQ